MRDVRAKEEVTLKMACRLWMEIKSSESDRYVRGGYRRHHVVDPSLWDTARRCGKRWAGFEQVTVVILPGLLTLVQRCVLRMSFQFCDQLDF